MPALATLLRQVLVEAGYRVAAVPDVSATLVALRDATSRVVVVFNGGAPHDGHGLLEAAADEPALRRHGYVLLTAYPEGLAPTWQPLLTALGA